MAIFYVRTQVISRSKRRSAVAAAAYRSCTRLVDAEGKVSDYTRKGGLVWDGVFLPDGAPERFKDRQVLWNEVERVETGKAAQLCREFVEALPNELSRDDQISIARAVAEYLANLGMCVDVAIHDPGGDGHNVHAHFMLTLREVDAGGFVTAKAPSLYLARRGADEDYVAAADFARMKAEGWEKVYRYRRDGETLRLTPSEAEAMGGCERIGRDPVKRKGGDAAQWNTRESVKMWRREIADITNAALERAGMSERVSHLSYAARGMEAIPEIREGRAVTAIERRERRRCERLGVEYRPVTQIAKHNAEIRRANALLADGRGVLSLTAPRPDARRALAHRRHARTGALVAGWVKAHEAAPLDRDGLRDAIAATRREIDAIDSGQLAVSDPGRAKRAILTERANLRKALAAYDDGSLRRITSRGDLERLQADQAMRTAAMWSRAGATDLARSSMAEAVAGYERWVDGVYDEAASVEGTDSEAATLRAGRERVEAVRDALNAGKRQAARDGLGDLAGGYSDAARMLSGCARELGRYEEEAEAEAHEPVWKNDKTVDTVAQGANAQDFINRIRGISQGGSGQSRWHRSV